MLDIRTPASSSSGRRCSPTWQKQTVLVLCSWNQTRREWHNLSRDNLCGNKLIPILPLIYQKYSQYVFSMRECGIPNYLKVRSANWSQLRLRKSMLLAGIFVLPLYPYHNNWLGFAERFWRRREKHSSNQSWARRCEVLAHHWMTWMFGTVARSFAVKCTRNEVKFVTVLLFYISRKLGPVVIYV